MSMDKASTTLKDIPLWFGVPLELEVELSSRMAKAFPPRMHEAWLDSGRPQRSGSLPCDEGGDV